MKTALALVAGLVFAAFATPAAAQLSENGGPVSYSADNLEYFDAERRLVLTGDVDVIQDDARLRADRLTLYFAPSAETAPATHDAPGGATQPAGGGGFGSGDIQRMVAEGEVYFVRPDQSARGDRADYNTAEDTVVFRGNVVAASGENVIRGETMTMAIGSRRTVVRPAAGERVRGVIIPDSGGSNNR
jgi:lipopolysaccharide export system protein LptA